MSLRLLSIRRICSKSINRAYSTRPPATPSNSGTPAPLEKNVQKQPRPKISRATFPLNVPAALARQRSTPTAVRLRRIKTNQDQLKTGLTTTEQDRYLRLTKKGQNTLPIDAWTQRLYDRRSRIRGLEAVSKKDANQPGVFKLGRGMGYGESGRVRIVGKKIYLPNFRLYMIPNHTLAGHPYNPMEATFRIPKNLTKNDVRSYLYFAYGVQTTWIRTENHIGQFKRLVVRGRRDPRLQRDHRRTYKTAVVGLVEPFYYPDMLEDMSTKERFAFNKEIDDAFSRPAKRRQQAEIRHQVQSVPGEFKYGLAKGRSAILKRVAESRRKREALIQKGVEDMTKSSEDLPTLTV